MEGVLRGHHFRGFKLLLLRGLRVETYMLMVLISVGS